MANPGDRVKVITQNEELEGIFIQKPILLGEETIILKLKSGYNIGIEKSKVKKIEVVEAYKEPKEKSDTIKQKKGMKTVSLLSLGGTISSKVDYTTGGVHTEYTAKDFVEMCPELYDIANIQAKNVMKIMSEDMSPKDWMAIAQAVADEDADGIVITTGTDTLGYLAAALSFMVKPNKPVILTASQRSIDRGSSDAFFNLICAVKAAAEWDGNEIVTCMHGTSADDYCSLIRGTKVRKMSTSRRDAFKPINETEFAHVTADTIEITNDNYKKEQELTLLNAFEENVALVYIYPGMSSLNQYKNHRGIILMGTGFGYVPKDLYGQLKELIDAGVFVGMTSQCISGRTSSTVYSPLREIAQLGVVHLQDMLPETAYVKLGWVLAQDVDVKEKMLENISGEINERITLSDLP